MPHCKALGSVGRNLAGLTLFLATGYNLRFCTSAI
jgi:hypothetical protein